jgi:hypothetical protein
MLFFSFLPLDQTNLGLEEHHKDGELSLVIINSSQVKVNSQEPQQVVTLVSYILIFELR